MIRRLPFLIKSMAQTSVRCCLLSISETSHTAEPPYCAAHNKDEMKLFNGNDYHLVMPAKLKEVVADAYKRHHSRQTCQGGSARFRGDSRHKHQSQAAASGPLAYDICFCRLRMSEPDGASSPSAARPLPARSNSNFCSSAFLRTHTHVMSSAIFLR